MIINTAFIHIKKIQLIFEFLHILIGIIISLYNNIMIFNVILYIGLILSFCENIVAIFCLQRYIENTNMIFRDTFEFNTWEKKTFLPVIESALFYIKTTVYLVISILTIRFFYDIENIPFRIYLIQLIFQVVITFALRIFNISLNPLIQDEVGNTMSSLENNIQQLESVESLETFEPVYEQKIEVLSDDECSICMDKNNLIWVSLPCEHKFHEECIFKWIETDLSCPICRKQLGNNV